MTEGNRSSNEDLLFGKSETQTKNDNNISPPKKPEDRSSGIPRPPRDKSARRQLVLDISGNKAKSAVLSLASPTLLSPDPTKRRTQSSSSIEMIRRQSGVQPKPRPPSAAATLSISPRKVRQINDPILQILNQLHKIIFITQLPPTLTSNANRRIVEKFKRALFSQQTGSFNLKSEIKKVLEGSKEIIDLSFGFDQPTYLSFQNTTNSQASPMQAEVVEGDTHGAGITYEQMQAIVESVLMESGYYDVSPNIKDIKHHRPPLGPIGGLNGR